MGEFVKRLDAPDEVLDLPAMRMETVDMGDVTVAWQVLQPGWRWSRHVQPHVGGEWCQARHVGIVLSGRMRVVMKDGTTMEMGARDAYVVPPGHDGIVVGDEPVVALEWGGARNWVPALETLTERVLATLVMTDIVNSTALASEMGDRAWRARLADVNEVMRDIVGRYRGREVKATGDGFLITFDGAGRAVRCAIELVRASAAAGLPVRAAVHTGEIELVGEDVRGLNVHEVARMLALAGEGVIVTSALTHQLAGDAAADFADRGEVALRGLDGQRRLFTLKPGA